MNGIIEEIIKELAEGQDIYSLFIKAINIIGQQNNRPNLVNEAADTIRTVYGYGLLQQQPLLMQIDNLKAEIGLLQAATFNEGIPPTEQWKIYKALKYRKNELDHLNQLCDIKRENGETLEDNTKELHIDDIYLIEFINTGIKKYYADEIKDGKAFDEFIFISVRDREYGRIHATIKKLDERKQAKSKTASKGV